MTILTCKMKKKYNFKPALHFDQMYGTSLHTEYEFPGGITADEAYRILSGNWFWQSGVPKRTTELINSLREEHFPARISELSMDQKYHVLQGMAAGLPQECIVYFSIEGIVGYRNNAINRELEARKLEAQWVVSPETWKKNKETIEIM